MKKSRDKGGRVERDLVNLFKSWGLRAERVGVAYASGHDVDVYKVGRDAPLCGESKARSNGFKQLYAWLDKDGADFLALKADRRETLFVVPERIMRELIT